MGRESRNNNCFLLQTFHLTILSQAATTKDRRLCDSNNKNYFLTALEAQDQGQAGFSFWWWLSPWLVDSCFLIVCSYAFLGVYMCWEGSLLIPPSYKDTNPTGLGLPPFWLHLTLIISLLEIQTVGYITLASTHEFGERKTLSP